MLRALCDKLRGKAEESEVSSGMLFATGLVAGGTLTGVFSALLKAIPWAGVDPDTGKKIEDLLTRLQLVGGHLQKEIAKWSIAGWSIDLDYYSLIFYVIMGFILVKVALKKSDAGSPA